MESITRMTVVFTASALLCGSCKKENDATPTPTSNVITSLCIGEWRADSSFVPSTGLYNHHTAATFQFSIDGHLHIIWPDSSADDYDYYVGEEALNPVPNETGRSLIWATETGVPFSSGLGILMVFQTDAECFLLLSDDIGPSAEPNTLSTVTELVVVDGDPVFDFWAKCYRQ